jgi:hypothetical protein
VATSVESGFEVEGASATVSLSVSESYAHSEAFTDALTESADQWFTATCDPSGSAQKRAIYQFRTDTDETCLESGTCSGSTQTAEYVCALDAPADYAGPECVPGYCGDALCTVCDYPAES